MFTSRRIWHRGYLEGWRVYCHHLCHLQSSTYMRNFLFPALIMQIYFNHLIIKTWGYRSVRSKAHRASATLACKEFILLFLVVCVLFVSLFLYCIPRASSQSFEQMITYLFSYIYVCGIASASVSSWLRCGQLASCWRCGTRGFHSIQSGSLTAEHWHGTVCIWMCVCVCVCFINVGVLVWVLCLLSCNLARWESLETVYI